MTSPGTPPPASVPDATPTPVSSSRRRRRWPVLLAIPAVLVLAAVVWLFSSEGAAPAPPADLASLPVVDGTLNVVEADRLVMTPFAPLDGATSLEFSIPEQYAPNFDLAHLRSHSSVGIPTRIHYLERGGRLLAVYKSDAPVNTGS